MNEPLSVLLLTLAAVALSVLVMGALIALLPQKSVEKKYSGTGGLGGFGAGLDAVFSPTAFEAGQERDKQSQRTTPAPAPSDPPPDLLNGRIVIAVD